MTSPHLYDVAFSFLAPDEPLALELKDLLEDRFSTFVFSQKQESLAGTDGEETFAKVFGVEARIVVVLYRARWGQTSWTRIEDTAIRNRALDEGYDFTLWISLDGSALPRWVPKNRIYLDYQRYGTRAAAAVISAKIVEVGGEPQVETFPDRANRVAREKQRARDRESFLRSQAGVVAMGKEIGALFHEMTRSAEQVRDNPPHFTVSTERQGDSQIAVICQGATVTARFRADSGLVVRFYDTQMSLRYGNSDRRSATEEWIVNLDVLPNLTMVWRTEDEPERCFSSPEMADRLLSHLLTVEPTPDLQGLYD
jgi:hypothetical protein